MESLPNLFLERLKEIFNGRDIDEVLESFNQKKVLSARINSLKQENSNVKDLLTELKIEFDSVEWFKEAVVLKNLSTRQFTELDLTKQGFLYKQSLSSLLVPVILDPQQDERILDMCAAPGSKTSQMAAMMQNAGNIIAIEKIKSRYYKLKSVMALLWAENVHCHLMDARKYQSRESLFDKILLDAPCSSEGRFVVDDKKTFAYWSPRKIKEMQKKQKGLILHASRLLKPGGTLVYSTCTFSPEENEEVIDWLLKKGEGRLQLEPIVLQNIRTLSPVLQWRKKTFDETLRQCLRIFPDEAMEGFFIAKIQKRN